MKSRVEEILRLNDLEPLLRHAQDYADHLMDIVVSTSTEPEEILREFRLICESLRGDAQLAHPALTHAKITASMAELLIVRINEKEESDE